MQSRRGNGSATLILMKEEPDARSQIDECVASLKSKIPLLEHGALDSRVEQLLNDPSADSDDVILILLEGIRSRTQSNRATSLGSVSRLTNPKAD